MDGLLIADGFHWEPKCLIWRGHGFFDNIRNYIVWSNIKKLIAGRDGSASFDVVQSIVAE
jgi:hypothetical protein